MRFSFISVCFCKVQPWEMSGGGASGRADAGKEFKGRRAGVVSASSPEFETLVELAVVRAREIKVKYNGIDSSPGGGFSRTKCYGFVARGSESFNFA